MSEPKRMTVDAIGGLIQAMLSAAGVERDEAHLVAAHVAVPGTLGASARAIRTADAPRRATAWQESLLCIGRLHGA